MAIKQLPKKQISLSTLRRKLKLLGCLTDAQKKTITCALAGHPGVVNNCWGYVTCARCGEQLGDTLGGSYRGNHDVVVGHNCKICRRNFKKLSPVDRYLTPNPFKKLM